MLIDLICLGINIFLVGFIAFFYYRISVTLEKMNYLRQENIVGKVALLENLNDEMKLLRRIVESKGSSDVISKCKTKK